MVRVSGGGRVDFGDAGVKLDEIAAQVHAGKHFEDAWELFRVQHFPGRDHEEAAEELAEWALERDLQVDFETRRIRDQLVIFVLITVR